MLFIITDQQRADHVGFAGNDVVRTPHLDSIAARGTVFDNAWVANPVCMPNRSSIMTGRMPSVHGVIFNDRSLEWGVNTHVRQFHEAGYRTALIGKSHLQHGMSRNAVVNTGLQAPVDSPYPAGWDTLEHAERYFDGEPEFPDSFYGFGHVELAIDHGSRITGHHMRWALEQGASMEELAVPYSAECPGERRYRDWWQIYRPDYDEALHSSRFVAERTAAFIADAASAGEPWLAWASFPDPHHPMCPPGEWFDRHRPDEMELPRTVDDPLDSAPEHLRRSARLHPSRQQYWVHPCGIDGDHDLARAAIAATYGMVELIDDCVGQILTAVERAGAHDDTIVVFTTDHGDMMGDHGLLLKGCMHYRGTLQVPMVIASPGGGGATRTSSLASSVDLGPTLLELAGLEPYDGIQGVSLAPVLGDPAASVREWVLVEDDIRSPVRRVWDVPTKTRTLIADGMRYTRHSTGEDQLFCLDDDPDELTDLSTDYPTVHAGMVVRLADALMEATDTAR